MKMTAAAYAKINLFLDITARRPDGYHTIAGVMQAVSLCDSVTVEVEEPVGKHLCVLGPRPGRAEEICLTCSNPALPTDGKNLAWRAAEAFFAATGCGCRRLTLHIDKHIPAAAGLAGGSTDAAAVLRALNALYDRPLDDRALCAVGVKLGADVPFCILGGTHRTEGVGEVLTPLASMPACTLVIACAGEGVSTPAAYGALDRLYGDFAPAAYAPRRDDLAALCAALEAGSLHDVSAHTFNLFESAVLPERPVARGIRESLAAAGALAAMMSGSGPSVFGIFADPATAAAAAATLQAQGIPAWVCEPVTAP